MSKTSRPVLMVRDSLYWLLTGNLRSNHEFDLARRSLAVIPMLVDATLGTGNHIIWLMPAEGGGLGFLVLAGFCAQLWNGKKDPDGVASWVLGRIIQLDELLPLNPRMLPWIVGFADDNNEVLLCTSIGIVTVQLESLQSKKLSESDGWNYFYPFVVYTAVLHEPQGPMRGSSADAGAPTRPSPFGA
uniref:Uncharacterized protein n=1 Tax=Avena sativa TaxID=4498 RepID=A0ACD5V738_AVESA